MPILFNPLHQPLEPTVLLFCLYDFIYPRDLTKEESYRIGPLATNFT